MNASQQAVARLGFKEAFRLVLPKEHGSWSLAFEPIALGLLVAPSRSGFALALAAVAGFFLRRPLKLILQSKPDERRSLAQLCVATLLLLALTNLVFIFHSSVVAQLWPLLPAGGLGLIFVWSDARGESRAGAAEIAGAAAFAFLPAAFASLAGWLPLEAFALTAVMLARSVPTVMLVRTLLRRAKGHAISPAPVLLASALALSTLCWLATLSLLPWLTVAISGLMLARAGWLLFAPPAKFSARKLGLLELFFGVAVVLSAALAWHR